MKRLSQSDPDMTAASEAGLDYVHAFREFFLEVVTCARVIESKGQSNPKDVQGKLLAILARHRAEARALLPKFQLPEFQKAQYIMVAVADEVLLKLEWSHSDPWTSYLLEEEEPFGTHVAGDRIIDELEEIVGDRVHLSTELLRVYLVALALGFKGRCGIGGNTKKIAAYRQEVAKRLPEFNRPDRPEELCPLSREPSWYSRPRRQLRSMLRAFVPLYFVVFLYVIVVGPFVWWRSVVDAYRVLSAIDTSTHRHSTSNIATPPVRQR